MRKISKSGIILGIFLVIVLVGFVIWNGTNGSSEESSVTATSTSTTPTTTIPPVSFKAAQAGGTGLDGGRGVSVLPDDGAIVTGAFVGTAKFGSMTLTSSGEYDVLVGKIATTGVWEWVIRAGALGRTTVWMVQ